MFLCAQGNLLWQMLQVKQTNMIQITKNHFEQSKQKASFRNFKTSQKTIVFLPGIREPPVLGGCGDPDDGDVLLDDRLHLHRVEQEVALGLPVLGLVVPPVLKGGLADLQRFPIFFCKKIPYKIRFLVLKITYYEWTSIFSCLYVVDFLFSALQTGSQTFLFPHILQLCIYFIGAFEEGRVFFYACLVEDPTPNFPLPLFFGGGKCAPFPFFTHYGFPGGKKKPRQWRKKKVFFPFSHRGLGRMLVCYSFFALPPPAYRSYVGGKKTFFVCRKVAGCVCARKSYFSLLFFFISLGMRELACLSLITIGKWFFFREENAIRKFLSFFS